MAATVAHWIGGASVSARPGTWSRARIVAMGPSGSSGRGRPAARVQRPTPEASSHCAGSSSTGGSSFTSSRRHFRRRERCSPAVAAEAAAAAAADNDPSFAAASSLPAGAAAAVAAHTDVEAQPAAGTPPRGLSSLAKRAIFGTILGLSGAVVIIAGGWLYGLVACLAAYQCSKEFTGMVNAKGISSGMKPPPPVITSTTSLLCICLNAWVFVTNGRAASAMAVATFLILSLQLLAVRKPRFSQLTSSVFGLLYCGYLPSFWIKLRLLAIPAAHSQLAQRMPPLLGGATNVTVGMIAAFTAVACIIAADTGAFFFGKAFGRTKLTSVSPKKTVEGAVGGLLCSIAVSVGCYQAVAWPDSVLSAAALGTIVFFAGLFGDLIESVIKRDAGLKDASNLIPGHGGLLDRLDSYLFTGACVYFAIKFFLPGYGLGLLA